MSDEPLASSLKDEDVLPDEHIVSYDISEIDIVMSQLSEIHNAMANLKSSFQTIETAVTEARMSLHKVTEEELPW